LAVSVNGPLDQPCATNTVDPATTAASGNETNAARFVAHRTGLRRNTGTTLPQLIDPYSSLIHQEAH
jgi:hypothetical protein